MKESPHASVRAPDVKDMENFMQLMVFMKFSTLLWLKRISLNSSVSPEIFSWKWE